jgi:hypothetical protein
MSDSKNQTNIDAPFIPVEVQVDTDDGVDPQALLLATAFMDKMGGLARLTNRCGELSNLYITTMASWASPELIADNSTPRHFKQILFALVHRMRVVRVMGEDHILVWNKFLDNSGLEVVGDEHSYKVNNSSDAGRGREGVSEDGRGRLNSPVERPRKIIRQSQVLSRQKVWWLPGETPEGKSVGIAKWWLPGGTPEGKSVGMAKNLSLMAREGGKSRDVGD